MHGEEELRGCYWAGGAPLDFTPRVSRPLYGRVEGGRRAHVVPRGAVAGAPDTPRARSLLHCAELGSATFERGCLPPVGPVTVVDTGLLHPLDVLGRAETEDEQVVEIVNALTFLRLLRVGYSFTV